MARIASATSLIAQTKPMYPMKPSASTIILAVLASALVAQEEPSPVEPAETYPDTPTLAELMAVQVAEAESFPRLGNPGNPSQLAQVATGPEITSPPGTADPMKLAQSVKLPAVSPPTATGDPVNIVQSIQSPVVTQLGASGDPSQLGQALQRPSIAFVVESSPLDPFALSLQFHWKQPHGQWMSQLLKDIDAAKKAGDLETYNALTARYTAWANKYLRPDAPPKLDGKPGR
jgi:hypothetical protein